MNIYPAILTDSLELVQKQVNLVQDFKKIKTIQIDVVDGYFFDNLTITPMDLVDVSFGRFSVDFHLMTEEPLSFAEEVIDHKEYFSVRSVIGQIEKMTSQADFVKLIKEHDLSAGLSLDLFTPHQEILDSVFKQLDVLQLMAIEAGEQGHVFNDRVLDKVKEVKKRADAINPELEIIIDGGVKLDTIEKLEKVGVDSVGIGSALWKSENINDTLEGFLQYVE